MPSAPSNLQDKNVSSPKMGNKLSDKKGSGMEFSEYRVYQSGDDAKYIDWRISARLPQLLVKTFQAENQQNTVIVVDKRASMRFGTKTRLKVTQALRLTFCLASQKIKMGYSVSIMLVDEKIQCLKPVKTLASLLNLFPLLSQACPPINADAKEVNWKSVFNAIHHKADRGSLVYILSDFLTLAKHDAKFLPLMGKDYHTTAVRIYDELEEDLTLTTPLTLVWGDYSYDYTAKNDTNAELITAKQNKNTLFLKQHFSKARIDYLQLSGLKNNLKAVLS